MTEVQSQLVDPRHFPCQTCGGDLRYNPTSSHLACVHCGETEALDLSGVKPVVEQDFNSALQKGVPAQDIEETQVTPCPNCGAQVEFDAFEKAKECAFCATPVVGASAPHRHIKPRGILPFALTEEEARKEMTQWLGGLWFAPNGLQKYARKGRKIRGIYLPYWTFDAQTKSQYHGQRGDDYFVNKTVMRDGKPTTVQERRTKWRHVSGRVARFFDDILVLASPSLPEKFTKDLAPWDLSEMEPYLPDYLAGFEAEAYSVELEDGYVIAAKHMERVILRDVKFDIGGDRQRVHDINTQISDVTFKHVLLPIWMAAYKYKGKSYRFVVNGRTGRVQGERPYSIWKIASATALALIVAGIAGYLYSQYSQ